MSVSTDELLVSEVATADVRDALIERREIALLDVRDEASFAEAHPLFAASLPLDRFRDVFDRIPRRTTRIAVYGDGAHPAADAIQQLRGLGYVNVAMLDGGLDGWRR